MKFEWDVIIIGARIAGSTLASYLGRAGLRVLLLDRADFPSDIPQQASWDITANRLWNDLGVLASIEQVGVPRQIAHYFATDDIIVPYSYASIDEYAFRLTVRRIKLDDILSHYAASFPSVELCTSFPIERLIWDGGRVIGVYGGKSSSRLSVTARLVVGADGRNSLFARQVEAVTYEEISSPWASYFAHYSNTNAEPGVGHYARTADTFFVASMADEGLLTASVSIQNSELKDFRRNLPQSFEKRLCSHPHFQAVIGNGRRQSSIGGACNLKMYKRFPWGTGWALLGDAGYHLDPMSARGVTAAVVSAHLLADSILTAFSGTISFEGALDQYHQKRDQQLAYEWALTHRILMKGPPSEEDRKRARFLAGEPELRRLQMLAQYGYGTMEEFNQAVSDTLKMRAFEIRDTPASR